MTTPCRRAWSSLASCIPHWRSGRNPPAIARDEADGRVGARIFANARRFRTDIMTGMYRAVFATGCVFGALGVIAGAAGAHHFQSMLAPRAYASYSTACSYLLWHAVALVALGAWLRGARAAGALHRICAGGIIAGTVLFTGSLFGWSIGGWSWARHAAPWGGSTLILSWCGLAATTWRSGTGPAD